MNSVQKSWESARAVLALSVASVAAASAGAQEVIAVTGGPAPALPALTLERLLVLDVTPSGAALVRGDLLGPGVTTANDRAWWSWESGTFELLLREGQAIGAETVQSVGAARLADNGDFLCTATIAGGGSAVFRRHAGAFTRVVGTGDTIPGVGTVDGVFSSTRFVVNDAGAFAVRLSEPDDLNPGQNIDLLIGVPAGGTPAVVSMDGMTAPNGVDVFQDAAGSVNIDAAGRITLGTLFNGLEGGLYRWDAGTLTEVLRTGDATDRPAESVGTVGQWLGSNASGAFVADGPLSLSGGGFSTRVYRAAAPSTPVVLAGEGETAVPAESATFEWPTIQGTASNDVSNPRPVIADSGTAAFFSDLGGVDPLTSEVLWLAEGAGAPQIAVRTGDPAGDLAGVAFGGLNIPFFPSFGFAPLDQIAELNRAGGAMFYAELRGAGVTEANGGSIWFVASGEDPTLLLREGDTLTVPGGAVRTLTFSDTLRTAPTGTGGSDGQPRRMSDAGTAFLSVDFTDASQAVVRLDLPATNPACSPADLDANGTLNLDDIDLFASAFLAGDLLADLDASGDLNLDDIDAFATAFLAGCP